jgi:hypothetical protein
MAEKRMKNRQLIEREIAERVSTKHSRIEIWTVKKLVDQFTTLEDDPSQSAATIVNDGNSQREFAAWTDPQTTDFLECTFIEGDHIEGMTLVEIPDSDSIHFDEGYQEVKSTHPTATIMQLDGQHRSRTLVAYIGNTLQMYPPRRSNHPPMYFCDLDPAEKEAILNRQVAVNIYYDTPHWVIGTIFSNCNSGSKPSDQENLHVQGGWFKDKLVSLEPVLRKSHPWMHRTNAKKKNHQEMLQLLISFIKTDSTVTSPDIRSLWKKHFNKECEQWKHYDRLMRKVSSQFKKLPFLADAFIKKEEEGDYKVTKEYASLTLGYLKDILMMVRILEESHLHYRADVEHKLLKELTDLWLELYLSEDKIIEKRRTGKKNIWIEYSTACDLKTTAYTLKQRIKILKDRVIKPFLRKSTINGVTDRVLNLTCDKLRREVSEKTNGICLYTGRMHGELLQSKKTFVLDHIDPISEGGSDCIENLILVCAVENKRKGSKLIGDGPGEYDPPTEWRPEHGWTL